MIIDDRFLVPLLFNAPRSSAQWDYVTRVYNRAENLLANGYEYTDQTQETVKVVTPAGETYTVTLPFSDPFADPADVWHCTCAAFAKDKDCKHRIRVAIDEYEYEEKQEREKIQLDMLALMDKQAFDAECEAGCDYHL